MIFLLIGTYSIGHCDTEKNYTHFELITDLKKENHKLYIICGLH
jgi:hypothetical protein